MPSYQGAGSYQGYDPELDRLKQRRDIAEALQQGALETGPKSLPEGIAQIGKALIARQAMKKANKAGDAYASNQKRIADLFVSQMFPGDAAAMAYPELPMQPNTDASNVPGPSQTLPASTTQGALSALTPMKQPPASVPSVAPAQPQVGADPTSQAMLGAPARKGAMTPWSIPDPGMSAYGQATPPAGAMQPQGSAAPMAARGGFTPQQQQAGSDAAQVRAMIAMGMNPMEAAAAVKGEQRQRLEDARYAAEQNRPKGVSLGDGAFAEYDPNAPAGSRLNMLRQPAESPVKMEQYTDATGQVWDRNPYTGESVKANVPRARVPGSEGGGSGAPPSGYRWNPDGSLSKISGGPADKPEPGLYTPTEEKNFRSKAGALNTLKFLTNEYRTLVNQYGPGLFDASLKDGEWQKTPEGQKLLASHNNLMMFLKGPELFNLGVLTGPDVERLQRTLPEPVGMGAFGQSKETLGIGLDSLDQLVGYQMTMIPEEMRAVQGGGNAGAKLDARVVQDPAMQMGIRAYAKQSNLPAEAITEFLSNPTTPEEIAEFNTQFGEGQAEAILRAMQGGR